MRHGAVLRGRARLLARGALGGGRAGPFAAGLALLIALLVGIGARAFFRALATQGVAAREAAPALGAAFSATMLVVLLFDVQSAVAALVADSDLEPLRLAPLTPSEILLLKVGDVLASTLLPFLTLALPAAVGFALAYPFPLWGLGVVAPALLAVWTVPVGFGVGAALLLLVVAPPRRAREALGLLSTLALTLAWFANSFLVPRLALHAEGTARGINAALVGPAWLEAVLPGAWAARSLAAAAAGDARAALAALGVAAAVAALGAGLALAAARGTLGVVLERVAAPAAPGLAPGRMRPLPPARGAIAAIAVRDARLVLRDWTAAADVVTAAVLWMLLPVVARPAGLAVEAGLARLMLLALTVGLGYEIAARSLPLEREALAWSRLAPVPEWRWIAGKLAGAALLALPIFALAVAALATAMPLPRGVWPGLVALALPGLATALGFGVWAGAAFGDPAWKHARGMLTVEGRFVTAFGMVALALGWWGLGAWLDASPPGPGETARLVLPSAIALGAIALPLTLACRRLAGRDWQA